MDIKAFTTRDSLDLPGLLALFQEGETLATGTVVMHHGKVKRPGKKVPGFSRVELSALVPDPDRGLLDLAARTARGFSVNQVLLVHRLGTVDAGEDVLFAAVSAPTRDPAFKACALLVDAVKQEGIIRLTELP